MAWYSPYLPWNWPADVSHSFLAQLQAGLAYLLHVFLTSLLAIIQTLLGTVENMFGTLLAVVVLSIHALGPMGLPLFTTFFIVVVGIAMDLFHFAKDLPIVGDFI